MRRPGFALVNFGIGNGQICPWRARRTSWQTDPVARPLPNRARPGRFPCGLARRIRYLAPHRSGSPGTLGLLRCFAQIGLLEPSVLWLAVTTEWQLETSFR